MTPDEFLAELDHLGIKTTTITHPPLFTVEDSQSLRGEIAGGHCKNLFLKDEKGALFLLVALEDAVITLNQLHKKIGCKRLSFGRPELLMEVLGIAPGSVSPFALINDKARRVTVLLDQAMLSHDKLNYHPLVNTMTTTIGREDLLKFITSLGYTPQRIDLAPAPGA